MDERMSLASFLRPRRTRPGDRAQWILPLFGLVAAAGVLAQDAPSSRSSTELKRLTEADLYGPERVDFGGSYKSGMRWIDAGHWREERERQPMKVDARTDEATPLYDLKALQDAFAKQGDFDDESAERYARRPGDWNEARTVALVEHKQGLYLVRRAGEAFTVQRVHESLPDRRETTLGPAARRVVYIREHNLHAIDVDTGQPRALTTDGSDRLLNGLLDWVYQEEVYGRGTWKAYWISPDDQYVAFLQLNEADVPSFTLVDQIPGNSRTEVMDYPKAGNANPTVKLGVVKTDGGPVQWVDLSRYDPDILIVAVSWTPDGKVLFSVQDRVQTWLDLNEADPASGATRTLIQEKSPAWTNVIGHPTWLKDGSFLWRSERDGFQHIYHYARDGALRARLTEGEWEVRDIEGVDEQGAWVYFTGIKDTALETQAYRVPLGGGAVQRLTELGSSHSVSFNPDFTLFLDTFSNVTTPPKVVLRSVPDGAVVRVVSENDVPALKEYAWGEARHVRVPTRDGFPMWGRLLLPVDYQPGTRYPVWTSVYAGPASQTVFNRWGGVHDQLLATEGYIVWRIDPRSASGQGARYAWEAYKRLGQVELADIEDSIRWLIDQGYADPQRIGITGHSYGGYMAAYALTHSKLFKCGIAGSPVTAWENYDTIYTERYMLRPQDNPDGYAAGSVVKAAENLHGRLLIIHGLMDDNVHFQNTAQLLQALQDAGKQFDLMVYPTDRHGIHRGAKHYRELTMDFIRRNL